MFTGRFRFAAGNFPLGRLLAAGILLGSVIGPRFTADPTMAPATVPTGPAITPPMTAPATIRTTRRRCRPFARIAVEREGVFG